MDGKSKETFPEIHNKDDTKSGSSVCCSSNACGTTASSSMENEPQCQFQSFSELTTSDSDEQRDEMIDALAWASCRAFQYRPSDPIHYLAYQLLRWRYGDISAKITPGMAKINNKYSSNGRKISSLSFCSDQCEDTCMEQSSENEVETTQ